MGRRESQLPLLPPSGALFGIRERRRRRWGSRERRLPPAAGFWELWGGGGNGVCVFQGGGCYVDSEKGETPPEIGQIGVRERERERRGRGRRRGSVERRCKIQISFFHSVLLLPWRKAVVSEKRGR